MNKVYLLTGSNLGNRLQYLQSCKERLETESINVIQCSSVYETASWGSEQLPSHLNQALFVETQYAPLELLSVIHNIENDLGRRRQEKWGLRTIDIDIIFYNDETIHAENLIIPHPLMHLRKFVLAPLAEIAGEYIHPVFKKKISKLLIDCEDKLDVKIFNSDN